MIGDDIEVSVLSIMGEKVRIGIQAPRNIPVFRKEVYLEIQQEKAAGGREEVEKALENLVERRAQLDAPARLAHQPGKRLEHRDGHDHDRERDRRDQQQEPQLLSAFDLGAAAGAGALDRRAAKLLAALTFEDCLLLELPLELSHALTHAHRPQEADYDNSRASCSTCSSPRRRVIRLRVEVLEDRLGVLAAGAEGVAQRGDRDRAVALARRLDRRARLRQRAGS